MKRVLQAFASALTLEALVLGGGLAWLATRAPPAPLQVIPLTIEAEAPRSQPVPEPQAAIAPVPRPVPPRPVALAALRPPRPAAAAPPLPSGPSPEPARPAPATEVALPGNPAPAPVAPPAPSPAGPAGPSAEYIARVKAAVQAAVVYPPAAAALNFQGRARVEFSLRDGRPGQARIIVTSGMGLVDRAALQSVQTAAYPLPAAAFSGRDELYQVWVEFGPAR